MIRRHKAQGPGGCTLGVQVVEGGASEGVIQPVSVE